MRGRTIERLTLFDLRPPPVPQAPFPVDSVGGDLAELPAAAIPPGTDVVFHLAAVVSAAAEADYELGRRVNLRGTDAVIDACRRLAAPPAWCSPAASPVSAAGRMRCSATMRGRCRPTATARRRRSAELLLADASRRGFLDAVCLRLPTIMVRPGRPNKAASSFVSAILREPLLGLPTELPVRRRFRGLGRQPAQRRRLAAARRHMDTGAARPGPRVNPPGMSVTVGAMLAALERVRPGASALVRRVPDPAIAAIVGGWPAAFAPARATAPRLRAARAAGRVVRAFVEDDLEATRRERERNDRNRSLPRIVSHFMPE